MTTVLLSQAGFGIAHYAILAVIICAVVGIAWVAIKASGINPPGWLIQIFWIVVVAIVAILAIKLLLSVAW